MKGIFVICVIVISGLFWYEPQTTHLTYNVEIKKDVISPDLKECEMYRKKIEQNLKNVNK